MYFNRCKQYVYFTRCKQDLYFIRCKQDVNFFRCKQDVHFIRCKQNVYFRCKQDVYFLRCKQYISFFRCKQDVYFLHCKQYVFFFRYKNTLTSYVVNNTYSSTNANKACYSPVTNEARLVFAANKVITLWSNPIGRNIFYKNDEVFKHSHKCFYLICQRRSYGAF